MACLHYNDFYPCIPVISLPKTVMHQIPPPPSFSSDTKPPPPSGYPTLLVFIRQPPPPDYLTSSVFVRRTASQLERHVVPVRFHWVFGQDVLFSSSVRLANLHSSLKTWLSMQSSVCVWVGGGVLIYSPVGSQASVFVLSAKRL